MFKLNLNSFKNSRILITNKFIIFITKNGILKFNTNFFNLILYNNILYFNLYKTKNLTNNLMPLFINPIAFNSFYMNTKEKCYYLNYFYQLLMHLLLFY